VYRVKTRSAVFGLVLLLAGVAIGLLWAPLLLQPSSRSPTQAVSPAGLPGAAPSDAVRDAQLLGMLVQSELVSDASFPIEPKTDVLPAGQVIRVCAQLSKVESDSITYDAVQYFTGPAAFREASKDGYADVSLESYDRNRYVHPQTMHIATESAVFLQNRSIDAEGEYGPSWSSLGDLVTYAEFFSREKGDETYLESLYWITVGPEGVCGIEEIFAP
jgi:hypothetical protein